MSDAERAKRRMWADRPSPALPLLLLAAVVAGGIVMTLVQTNRSGFYFDDPARLAYWVLASLAAYLVIVLVARHQGYRGGIWVDRSPLAVAGTIALIIAVAVVGSWFVPGDLLIRGNVPVLALAAGVVVWAYRERRLGLWILAVVLVPLALLANLYDMENVLFRLGVQPFRYADQVVNLGVVAIVLLIAAGGFGLARLRGRRPR